MMRVFRCWLSGVVFLFVLAGCQNGSSAPPPPSGPFTIGGTVSGLTGTGLVLQNNGGDDLSISANGTFVFTTAVARGGLYVVSVQTQPMPAQQCTLVNGSGTARRNVSNIEVKCGFSVSIATDPMAMHQWHLHNTGQTAYADVGGVAGMDLNVDPVFGVGITGNGVIAAVVDTGLEIAHEDLAINVVPDGSWNFGNSTTDPTNTTTTTGDHGTSVSGLIAAARNNVGGIGVAPGASLKGFNFLTYQSTANQIASLGGSTASPNSSDVSVFNQSLGYSYPFDFLVDPVIESQYASGVTTLRGGKGALYVKAAGNGFISLNGGKCSAAITFGISCQNASFDPYNTLPYQIVVGAMNANGIKSSYSTAGSAIWVSATGGEYGYNSSVLPFQLPKFYEPAMVSTDQSGCTNGYSRTTSNSSVFNKGGAPNTSCNYTNSMNGTSSATPSTAGVIALMLEVNPELTWRDVKHILATTARQIDASRAETTLTLSDGAYVAEPAWMTNAAGYHYHNWYGFGLVDAEAAVNMARSYKLGSLKTFKNSDWIASPALALAIPDNSTVGAGSVMKVPKGTVSVVEAVQIHVNVTHPYAGDLAIELVSPSGTRSVLKNGRDGFWYANLDDMVLLSNVYYGEKAVGNWIIKILDVTSGYTGTLNNWAIRVHGH